MGRATRKRIQQKRLNTITNVEAAIQKFSEGWKTFISDSSSKGFLCILGFGYKKAEVQEISEFVVAFCEYFPDPFKRQFKIFIRFKDSLDGLSIQKNDAVSRLPLKPSPGKGFKPHFLQRDF